MSYKELYDMGFDLSDQGLRPIKHLISIDGYNSKNYTYSITSNGIGYLEEYEQAELERHIDLKYQSKTIAIAEKANKLSEDANQQSKIANQIAKSANGLSKKSNALAEEANKNSKFSNKLSIVAICISAFSTLLTIGSLIVAIVALCK